jgi:RNA polymerase sigma-70 factor, ECF subfamily
MNGSEREPGISMTSNEEKLLIQRLQLGDPLAFEEMMSAYLPAVYSLALRISGNPADAEDIAQEVFLAVYRHNRQFKWKSKFTSWLYRITVNEAYKNMRRGEKVRKYEPMDDTHDYPDTGPTALDRMISASDHEMLSRSIASLPPKQKSILLLRMEKNLPFKEIALIMKRSIGAVKANFFHAVRALEKAMNREVLP